MKKFFKGVGIFFAILIIVALSIMLYANYSNYTYDKEKTIEYLTKNAETKSRTWCAWYVMRALNAGGCPAYLLPAYGYSWLLPQMEFVEVSKKNYTPLKGDIIVFPAVGKHIWGHIQMWNGEQWISDFKQRNMIPAKAYYNTNWKIYRHNSYFYTGLEP